jgi:hypothetical protein
MVEKILDLRIRKKQVAGLNVRDGKSQKFMLL